MSKRIPEKSTIQGFCILVHLFLTFLPQAGFQLNSKNTLSKIFKNFRFQLPVTLDVSIQKHSAKVKGKSKAKPKKKPTFQDEVFVPNKLLDVPKFATCKVLIDNMYAGRLSHGDAVILAPLVLEGLLRVEASVSEPAPSEVKVGTIVLIQIDTFVAPWAFTEINRSDSAGPSEEKVLIQGILRDAWRGLWNRLCFGPVREAQQDLGQKMPAEIDSDLGSSESPEEDGTTINSDNEEFNKRTTEVVGTSSTNMPEKDPTGQSFKATLRCYQKQGLFWMWNKEVHSDKASSDLHPSWDEYLLPTSAMQVFEDSKNLQHFYFNRMTGQLTFEFPCATEDVRGGLLVDEMGLGKTIQSLSLICEDFDTLTSESKKTSIQIHSTSPEMPVFNSTLIVVPLSLLAQWTSEIATHTTLTSLEFYGQERERSKSFLMQANIVLTTYGTLRSEYKNTMKEEGTKSPLWSVIWRRVILDEAHIIKAKSSHTFHAANSLLSQRRWCLTGTPIQNTVDDLFALLRFLRVQPYGTWSWWQKNISTPCLRGDTSSAVEAARIIAKDLILRRTKDTIDPLTGEKIVSLPPKTSITEEVSMTIFERDFYEAVYNQAVTEFDTYVESGSLFSHYTHIFQLLLKLRQTCCHPFLVFSRCGLGEIKALENIDRVAENLAAQASEFQGGNEQHNSNVNFLKGQLEELRKTPENPSCPICMDEIEDGVLNVCGHMYCRECIYKVMETTGKKADYCPICRQFLSPETLKNLPSVQKIPKKLLEKMKNNPEDFLLSSKMLHLKKHLKDDIEKSIKAVVFSQWTSYMDLLEIMFQNENIPFKRLDGSMTLEKRRKAIEWLKEEDSDGISQGRVLLISLRAGGVGLNLTAASSVYLMDLWWNPAVEDQAMQRVHRIGQTKPVKAVRFVVQNSVEMRIDELHRFKERQAQSVVENKKINIGISKKLGAEELKHLFARTSKLNVHGD
eukprot:GHVP01021582.1.p1 GENE.GHVP01021582.1~~GHVP01021582.1.p1  ORF type:complete len:960 (+),score=188.02 GHVP01021582.1:1511-4390(+)